MRTGLVYEILDMRSVPARLPMLGIVRTVPDGLEVESNGISMPVLYDDEDPEAFADDEAAGSVEVRTVDGLIVFQVLSLAAWRDSLSMFFDDVPEFDTESALQAYFWKWSLRR